ncbi:MAG: aldo/keto reductase [Rhodobacteraceae bacterium]|nr:aldo/keto reductase [Paracoccaceae bacterium]
MLNGKDLPALGFGTAPMGGLYSEVEAGEAFAMLEEAWEAGLRYFDTAPHYGQGRAERILGDFLRSRDSESWILSTKVGRLLTRSETHLDSLNSYASPLPFNQTYDYTYDGIMRSVEDSYQRLGLNRIDILLVHDIGRDTHGDKADLYTWQLLESGARALDELAGSGEIRAVGIGVNEVAISEALIGTMPLDILLLAGRYTLLDRTAEAHLLPLCLAQDVKVIVGGVFNSGILADCTSTDARWNYGPVPGDVRDGVSRINKACGRYDIPLPCAALAFPRRHDAVTSMLLGCASRAELRQCLHWMDEASALPAEFWQEMTGLGLR